MRRPPLLPRTILAATTALLLAEAPFTARAEVAASPAPRHPGAASGKHAAPDPPLTPTERTLHALNRFTFGPTPGQADAITRAGLNRWFEQQLHPATINDAALDQRLEAFPAMRLSQPDLFARFPTPGLIRNTASGGLPLPADPILHAIYTHLIAADRESQKPKPDPTSAANPSTDIAAGTVVAATAAPAPAAKPRPGPRPNLLGPDTAYIAPPKNAANKPDGNPRPPQNGRNRHADDLYPEAATQAILTLPPAPRVTRLLALTPPDLLALRRSLSEPELKQLSADLNPAQKETLASLQSPERVVTAEVVESRLERDLYSNRQLQAVMTDFWLNHFNVYLHKNQEEPYLLASFERDTILPHALGHFEDLLVAVASSPAMLTYLDNTQSIGPDSPAAGRPNPKQPAKQRGLNENYARELLELHTLGVRCEVSADHAPTDPTCGPGYTQADVTAVANILTGWTTNPPKLGATATYEDRRHEPGPKQVFGTTIGPAGEQEGLDLLHRLATSPATARFISTKLAVRFVSDDPPPALVDRMTKAWLRSHGDIPTVLRTLFHSPEFWSRSTYRGKIKTPTEFVLSAARASSADVTNPAPLAAALDKLGMPLFGMATPQGYSAQSADWVSTAALISRMNFALVLAGNRLPGTTIAWAPTPSAPPASPLRIEASLPTTRVPNADIILEHQLEQRLLGNIATEHTRQTVLAQTSGNQTVGTNLADEAERNFRGTGLAPSTATLTSSQAADPAIIAGLLLGSPDFQRR